MISNQADEDSTLPSSFQPGETMITIHAATKRYRQDKPPAVDNLTLEVEQGEIFGFLGPNGAGKSTTIKMLVGLLRQDSGSITVNGFDNINELLSVKRSIGYVPDEPMFYEKMTALRYLNFIADLFDISEELRSQRITYWTKRFSLDTNIQDPISSFSHGMKQKLGVIAALIHEPQLLILDEPMVGLDPKSSYILKEVMREFCTKGGTVFFSTHVMDVAERLCDRVGIINKGKLISCGTFAQLRNSKDDQGATLEKLFLELTNEQSPFADSDKSL
jgi:ABC-2 type transport system ATP-binding protein